MLIVKKIFEDNFVLVISKPAQTEISELEELGYPAHRLDKDTSGLMILAKNKKILTALQNQFQNRQVKKKYLALVLGNIPDKGKISGYLARDPSRKKPFIFSSLPTGKQRGKWRWSESKYQVIKKYKTYGSILKLLKISTKTGRTHQIRVHLSSQGFPLLGDKVYHTKESKKISAKIKINRQFLHAGYLRFKHPVTGREIELRDQLPQDLKEILSKLK